MEQTKLSKVDLVLALEQASLNYRVELQPEEAVAWAMRAEYYNAMEPGDMTGLVKAVNELMPTMQFFPGNPNNGRPRHTFLVGNEGSRVVYVRVPLYYLTHHFDGPWSQERIDILQDEVVSLGPVYHADEYDLVEDDALGFTVRYWWD